MFCELMTQAEVTDQLHAKSLKIRDSPNFLLLKTDHQKRSTVCMLYFPCFMFLEPRYFYSLSFSGKKKEVKAVAYCTLRPVI